MDKVRYHWLVEQSLLNDRSKMGCTACMGQGCKGCDYKGTLTSQAECMYLDREKTSKPAPTGILLFLDMQELVIARTNELRALQGAEALPAPRAQLISAGSDFIRGTLGKPRRLLNLFPTKGGDGKVKEEE